MTLADPRAERLASLTMFLAASVWGLYWVPLRMLSDMGIEGAWGVVYFNACPLIVRVPALIRGRRRGLALPGRALFIGAATGLGMGFYSTAIVMAPVIRVTMEFYLTSVWSTIIGVVWLSERLDARRIVAVLVGLTGLGLLVSGPSGASATLGLGDGLALASGLLWALGAAGMKRWPSIPVVASATFQFGFAVLGGAVLGVLVLAAPVPAPDRLAAAFPMAFSASTLLLLPSICAIFWAGRLVFPGRAAILMMSEALVAALSASILLPAEILSPWQWVGGIIVLAACLIGR